MSFLSFIPVVGGLIDKIFGSRKDRDDAKARLAELEIEKDSKQIEVNIAEAQHASMFVAGWRPFVGWIGAIAYGMAFVIEIGIPSVLIFLAGDTSTSEGMESVLKQLHTLPFITYISVLSGMLGLGIGVRSWEKAKGVSRERIR